MILVLNLSLFHNLFLGLEVTYLIPSTKCILFIAAFLSFLTGNFLVPLMQAWRRTSFMGLGCSLPSSLAQRLSL